MWSQDYFTTITSVDNAINWQNWNQSTVNDIKVERWETMKIRNWFINSINCIHIKKKEIIQ